MTALFELDGVTRRFVGRAETVTAVDDARLRVAEGEIVGLVGPSGSGKTTLLHLVIGWERPDSGRVIRSDAVERALGWAGLSMVPQGLGLLPELSAGENVEMAARLAGRASPAVGELYERLAIGALADRLPAELSLGEQQRFAVARAAVAGPRLVVADEPTAHQDERNGDRVFELFAELAAGGAGVVIATHDVRLLDRVDRVVEMTDGRLAERHQGVGA